MESHFGRDFSAVRVHTDATAQRSAADIDAEAYTSGRDIVFGAGRYAPETTAGRRLLAHELTHVVQQSQAGADAGVIRRQTIGNGCAAHEPALREAWAEGERMTRSTIESLDMAYSALRAGIVPPPFIANAIRNSFGDIGLEPGGMTYLPELLRRYGVILGGFTSGRTLRCDPESVPSDRNECDWRSAFVVVGDGVNIFLCPNFFAADVSATSRGLTLLHEMAHSALRAMHAGTPERQYPEAFFDCSLSMGLEFDDAKRNAFAFDRLADCLHGTRPSSNVTAEAPEGGRDARPAADAARNPDSRWSLSLGAGADVTPGAYRFASALSGRVSLRTGEFVVFNPIIGLNLLYLPPSDANPAHLMAATADVGLRIQQPLQGFYFDVAAGGYGGFELDPTRTPGGSPTPTPTGGLTGTVGLGWRFRPLEIGVETRALVPEAMFDRTQVLVFGRAALRFP